MAQSADLKVDLGLKPPETWCTVKPLVLTRQDDMATYYARVRIAGTTTPRPVRVEARSSVEAKKLIESQYGKVQNWLVAPGAHSRPPNWYK